MHLCIQIRTPNGFMVPFFTKREGLAVAGSDVRYPRFEIHDFYGPLRLLKQSEADSAEVLWFPPQMIVRRALGRTGAH